MFLEHTSVYHKMYVEILTEPYLLFVTQVGHILQTSAWCQNVLVNIMTKSLCNSNLIYNQIIAAIAPK